MALQENKPKQLASTEHHFFNMHIDQIHKKSMVILKTKIAKLKKLHCQGDMFP